MIGEYERRVESLFYQACIVDSKARNFITTFVNHFNENRIAIERDETVKAHFLVALTFFEQAIDDALNPKKNETNVMEDAIKDLYRGDRDSRYSGEGFKFSNE